MQRREGRRAMVAVAVLLAAAGGWACASTSTPPVEDSAPETVAAAPGWYENPRAAADSGHMVAAATAVSSRMQLAVDKAQTSARAELAEQLGARYEVLRKRFQEEVDTGAGSELMDRYDNLQRAVTDQVLQGTRPRKREVHPADSAAYRAYVLMELPLRRPDRRLLDRIMSDQEMYVRFRASRAFRDLKQAAQGTAELLENR